MKGLTTIAALPSATGRPLRAESITGKRATAVIVDELDLYRDLKLPDHIFPAGDWTIEMWTKQVEPPIQVVMDGEVIYEGPVDKVRAELLVAAEDWSRFYTHAINRGFAEFEWSMGVGSSGFTVKCSYRDALRHGLCDFGVLSAHVDA